MEENKELESISDPIYPIDPKDPKDPADPVNPVDQVKKGKKKKNFADPEGRNDQARIHG